MTTKTRLQVLDPTTESVPQSAIVAPRPDTLDGKVIGLLANGKLNSVEILQMVNDILADRYEFKQVVTRNKGNASRPCPADIMGEMADQCDVVITSSGD